MSPDRKSHHADGASPMIVNSIVLISQSSERDFTQNQPENSNSNINFNLSQSKNKPWPYEISLHTEIISQDNDADSTTPLFRSDIRYAIQFDGPINEKEDASNAFSTAWPYIREGLIHQLQEHGIPSAPFVPLTVTITPNKA